MTRTPRLSGSNSMTPRLVVPPATPRSSLVRPFMHFSRKKGPLRIAILSDFVRVPYANGACFRTRSLYQILRQCGHEVTILGRVIPTLDRRARAGHHRACRACR